MKKTLAILLALLLVLVNVAALAEDPTYTATEAFSFKPIPKNYYAEEPTDENEGTAAVVYPAETITFTAKSDTTNPDGGKAEVTVTALAVSAVSGNKIEVNVPALSLPGVYKFTINEVAGSTQGVTYTGVATDLSISVLVSFDLDKDPTGKTLKVENYGVTATGFIENEDGTKTPIKVDEIANTYKVADLVVTKTVSGNLGDKNKYFPVEVTLTPSEGKTVRSDITITGETITETDKVVGTIAAGDGWDAEHAKTVTIWVKDGSTITFKNVPENVTYTVKETEATEHLSAASDEPNNPDAYLVGGEVKTAATISATGTNKVDLTNKKDVTIDTGVNMETVPYIMLLAVAMIGIAVLALRKREEY